MPGPPDRPDEPARRDAAAASARQVKRRLAGQLAAAIRRAGWSKSELARRMGTSRSSLDRLLDPDNPSLTLLTLARAARALDLDVRVGLGWKRFDERNTVDGRVKTIKASEFEARCLELMDEVAETGKPIVITRNGRPVSRLVPAIEKPGSLYGRHRGSLTIDGDVASPMGVEWDAAR